MADWSKLGDFEVTTPIADLLQDISDKGIPTSKDEVSQVCCANSTFPLTVAVPLTPILAMVTHCCHLRQLPKSCLIASAFLFLEEVLHQTIN